MLVDVLLCGRLVCVDICGWIIVYYIYGIYLYSMTGK